MRTLKIAIILLVAAGLYSFNQKPTEEFLGTYEEFLAKFQKIKHPTKLAFVGSFHVWKGIQGARKIINKAKTSIIYYRLPEVHPLEITRMGPSRHRGEVLLASNDQFDLVVYSQEELDNKRRTYRIATFNKLGKLISMNYLGTSDRNNYVTIDMLEQNQFYLTRVERKRDYDTKHGYKPFAIVEKRSIAVTETGEINFEILPLGKEEKHAFN